MKLALQSLTGKYRGLQGNPCNENRNPAMRTGVPCNENRVFSVGIDSQGVPCEPYRVWVYSASYSRKQFYKNVLPEKILTNCSKVEDLDLIFWS